MQRKLRNCFKALQKKDFCLGETASMFNRVCEHVNDLGNRFGQLKLEAEPVEKDEMYEA